MAKIRSNPLYDRSAHFFENYNHGPRELTKGEVDSVKRLKDEIQDLETRGGSLRREIFQGFEVSMPFGIAAGIAYGSQFLALYNQLGYGFLTHKSVRDRRWEGNPMPHLFYLKNGNFEEGFTVSAEPTNMISSSLGMHCLGPEVWQPQMTSFRQANPDIPIILSGVVTQGRTHEEIVGQYVRLGLDAQMLGANAYEFNVSCPNEMQGHSGELQDNRAFLADVLQELNQKLRIPILVKIGHREDLTEFAIAVGRVLDGNGGIVAVNTKSAIIRNPDGSYAFGEERQRAGVSFEPLAQYAIDALRQLIEIRQESGYDFKIFSAGGVTRPNDVSERLNMGADAVESASGAMSDPTLGLEVRRHLLEQQMRA